MTRARLAMAAAAGGAAALVACAAEVEAEPRAGAALRPARVYEGCTQEDKRALMILLEDVAPGAAPIEIEIAGLDEAGLPQSIVLSPLRRENSRVRLYARAAYRTGDEVQFLAGEVVVAALEKNRRASGTYRLTLPDGTIAAGAFDAVWEERTVYCGG